MPPLLKIDIETSRTIAAMERLGDEIEKETRPVAKATADSIAAEARRRAPRGETGALIEGIRVEDSFYDNGYVVLTTRQQMPSLPIWLEYGTTRMDERPYFYAAAELEASGHDRRMRAAIQDAIDKADR